MESFTGFFSNGVFAQPQHIYSQATLTCFEEY